MKNSGIKSQDAAAFGKAMQALLQTAFSPDNFEPFLKGILSILAGCFGPGTRLAVVLKTGKRSAPRGIFSGISKTEQLRLLKAGKPPRAGSGAVFSAAIKPANANAGFILVRFGPAQCDPRAAARLIETAAQVIAARVSNERRDAELNREKDLDSAVKHIEELYLSFPGISLKEISRAVLDEARRMTGSRFGFVGYINQQTGWLIVPSLTADAYKNRPDEQEERVFKAPGGLLGWVLKTKKPLLTNSARSDGRYSGPPAGHVKIDKFLGAPAMSGRRILGLIALANPSADYTQAALETAQKLGRVYAMILHRKLAEDRQREEDAKYKAIISSSKDIIYTANLNGIITYISPRVEDYGYTPEETVGHSVVAFAHPEDKEFITKAFANAVKTGRTLPILPYRIRKKDGSYFYAEQKSGVVFHDGKPAYITGVIRDVTEQRKTETRLKESETLMRMVFETAKDAIFIKDMNGMYVKANSACAELLGTTPEQVIGRTDSDYFPQKAAAEIFRTDSEVVLTGKTLSLNNYHSFPAGSRHVNILKTPLKGADGRTIGLLGIARDITDLKKMETALALAQASEAVSKVARPMAHDFNNALAAIAGYATLIDDDLAASSPIKTEISQIIKAVNRAAELTSRFQDFARNPKIEEDPAQQDGA